MRNLNRGVISALVTTVVLVTFYLWESSVQRDVGPWPPPNFLGSTWYGALMLLLIPLSLGWWSLGVKRRRTQVIRLCFTLLVLAFCIVLILLYVENVNPDLSPWPNAGGGVR